MKNKVGVSDFVKRQTKNSGKTYTSLSFDSLAQFAQKEINNNNFKKLKLIYIYTNLIKYNLKKLFLNLIKYGFRFKI